VEKLPYYHLSLRVSENREGIEGKIEVTERRGRRSKKLLDNLKETRGYWKLKEEAVARTLRGARCGGGYGPVVRETTE
jgi:hypothetical protein